VSRELPVGTDDAAGRSWPFDRRLVLSVFVAFIVLQPAFGLLYEPLTGLAWLLRLLAVQALGIVLFAVAAIRQVAAGQRVADPSLAAALALGDSPLTERARGARNRAEAVQAAQQKGGL